MFQSTPPREGRLLQQQTEADRVGVNPRPHARGDRVIYDSPGFKGKLGFNPRPHARGDKQVLSMQRQQKFQSTPPREGRPQHD